MTVEFVLLISRQGKVRLAKWYTALTQKEKTVIIRDISQMVIGRPSKLCNFMDYKDKKIVFKRFASLYFIFCVNKDDNELYALEVIQFFVEILDSYFGNVCELDLIFKFHKAYFILDELILDGKIQETSKNEILRVIQAQDKMMESSDKIKY